MPNGWRVMITRDGTSFMNDEMKMYVAYRDNDGVRAVKPIVLALEEAFDPLVENDVPASIIPTELAEALFEQLAYTLLGITDAYTEINRLKRELKAERARVDKLISGIGSLGAKTEEQP